MIRKNIIVILSLLISQASIAQQPALKQLTIGTYTGISYSAGIFKALDNISNNLNESAKLNFETTAPISFEIGIRPQKKFAIGLLFSTQSFSGSVEGYTFNLLEDSVVIEDVNLSLKRYFVGITPKYIWRPRNGILELYSAARVGYLFWNTEITSADKNFELPNLLSLNRPSVGVVAVGGNVYITEKTTINFESAIAAPYVFRIGLEYHL